MFGRPIGQNQAIALPLAEALTRLDAARLMAEQHLPGIVVCEPDGRPTRILPGPEVLRFVIPRYVQDDAALARVIGDQVGLGSAAVSRARG